MKLTMVKSPGRYPKTRDAAAFSHRPPSSAFLTLLLALAWPSSPLLRPASAFDFRGDRAYFRSDSAIITYPRDSTKVDCDLDVINNFFPNDNGDGSILEDTFNCEGLRRTLRFEFLSNPDDGGWYLHAIVTNDDRSTTTMLAFRDDEDMDEEDRLTQVRVRSTGQYWRGDSLRVVLRHPSTGMNIGRFEARGNVNIAAFLNSGVNPRWLRVWNLCDEVGYDGSPRAENGVVSCNRVEICPEEPERRCGGGPTIPTICNNDLAPNSNRRAYFRSNDSRVTIVGGTPSTYSFCMLDEFFLTRTDYFSHEWFERKSGSRVEYSRGIGFGFTEVTEDGSRYIDLVEIKDNNGRFMSWSVGSNKNIQDDLRVPTGFDFFQCEDVEIEVVNRQNNGVYSASDLRVGGFLGSNFNPGSLVSYNPCLEYDGTKCWMRLPGTNQGAIKCGSSWERGIYLPPFSERNTGPVGIQWQGQNSYLAATRLSFTFSESADPYNFAVVKTCQGDSGTLIKDRQGKTVGCTWQDGSRNELFFEAERNTLYNDRYLGLSRAINNYDFRPVEWPGSRRRFESMIRIPLGYDGFECDEVQLDYIHFLQGGAPGTFKATNFQIAFELEEAYNENDIKFFRPCEEIGGRCSVSRNALSCGGVSQSFDSVYRSFSTFDTTFLDKVCPNGATQRNATQPPQSSAPGKSNMQNFVTWIVASGLFVVFELF